VLRLLFWKGYPRLLLLLFIAWFALWAVNPPHPADFVLEHVLTLLFVGFLIWNHGRFPLSNVSYTLVFVFLCLHVVGAHYTYAEVPYPAWFSRLGIDIQGLFGFERNHYDRLVHFCFGLLIAYPVREVFVRIARVRGFWGFYLPFDVMMSFSMLYELLEWGVAVVVAGDLGQSYLGTQGDVWDAHKDMALASTGGLIAMTVAALVNWRLRRDFAKEWAMSLGGADPGPLGEQRVRAMLGDRESGSR